MTPPIVAVTPPRVAVIINRVAVATSLVVMGIFPTIFVCFCESEESRCDYWIPTGRLQKPLDRHTLIVIRRRRLAFVNRWALTLNV